jgi:hypothetical protein
MEIWSHYAKKHTEAKIAQFLSELEDAVKTELEELLGDLAIEAYDIGFDDGTRAEEYAKEAAWERTHEA